MVTGYLPSAILKGFLYIVPFAMLAMAKISGSISKSREEIKACNMVFYFLIGNVFFLSVISGSLLEEIGMYFNHPKEIPSHLAGAVSAQVSLLCLYQYSSARHVSIYRPLYDHLGSSKIPDTKASKDRTS